MPKTGTPASNNSCGARGEVSSVTDSGPPEQDHALGLHLAKGLGRLLERHDLRIDPLLPHAPGDELGHLGAEIDDEDLVVGGGFWGLGHEAGSRALRFSGQM